MFFIASRFMRSATTLTSSEAGCGTEMPHWSAGFGCPITGETAIIGTFSSVATAIIAMVDGAVAVPIRRSTFSSSISLRALRVAAEGSEPSSSWISLIFSPLTSFLYSMAAWMPRPYGMPIEEPGPLSDVTKPIVMSACAVDAATRPPMRAVKLNILRIAFPLVENSRDLSEMSAWIGSDQHDRCRDCRRNPARVRSPPPDGSYEMSVSKVGSNLERRFVTTRLGRIHVAIAGTGFPILLLHQTPRSWDEYRDVLPLLGRDFRAIAMDTLGFGDSDRPAAGPSIELWAEGAFALLDALEEPRAAIVGHHTGAVITVEMAASAPARVSALVLSACPFVDAARRAR